MDRKERNKIKIYNDMIRELWLFSCIKNKNIIKLGKTGH